MVNHNGCKVKNQWPFETTVSPKKLWILSWSNQSFSMNGVKEAGANSGEGLSPGRCPTEQQGEQRRVVIVQL